ncbi:MAG: cytosine permease [Candidatus Dormibacteraeota bacterium]|nr:cytosine permease [Candidatus Dormibacteraeota bacterium]MBO0761151.1 cytosine permease [Candidatus Dormibacteraeota bacterium]
MATGRGETAVPVREGVYGERVAAVEPGGIEYIPGTERHGRPVQMFWTWMSPNLEFATIFVGVLGTAVFGGSFWVIAIAVALGSALGSLTHGVLSSWGPKFGVPQMVQGRGAFGFRGNFVPAVLMSMTSGIGWFAVNSVSATFALVTLVHVPFWIALTVVVLLQVIVAFFGHNLVHVWERYAFIPLVIVFAAATIVILLRAHLGQGASPKGVGDVAAFSLTAAAAFGYAVGWNPYASDYTRYLSPSAGRLRVGFWAGLGVFVSCLVLEVMGAALGTVPGTNFAGSPTDQLANALPAALAVVTLLCITLGGISANVLNIYSGAMAFLTLGIRIGARQRRAIVALVFGAIGFVVALIGGQGTVAHSYENFLLLISYWIAPWLAIMFTDYWLRHGDYGNGSIFYDRGHNLWSGVVAFVVATVVSIWLFANQTIYVGVVPTHVPTVGDLTFAVGFILAAVLYALGRRVEPGSRGA